MDPGYNMNNKEYGRTLMAHNEKLGTLAEEQSGSRKRRRASEITIKKESNAKKYWKSHKNVSFEFSRNFLNQL